MLGCNKQRGWVSEEGVNSKRPDIKRELNYKVIVLTVVCTLWKAFRGLWAEE